jgi:hypothetical protein
MQKPVPVNVARRLRARYMLAGAMLLAPWGGSVVALFHGGSHHEGRLFRAGHTQIGAAAGP